MRTSPPTRLPSDVYDSAVAQAAVDSRTVPQQVAHWARIGRELERSPRVNRRAIQQVLDGDCAYDLLGEREQAVVRSEWDERVVAVRGSLNFEAEFTAAGESYSEADASGNLVVHPGVDG